MTVNLLVWH